METNFVGAASMTRLVLARQRARGAGRILTVTSVGGVVGQPFNDADCAAKFATEGLMESLAPVAARFGVHIAVIEPGAVASAFVDNADASLQARNDEQDGTYRSLFAAYMSRAAATFAAAQSPADVAAVVVRAATEDKPQFRYQTSEQARAFVGLKLADLDGSAVVGATTGWVS